MNELQFLNNYCNLNNEDQISPGQHIYELSKYYTNIKIIIIDPSKHKSILLDNLNYKIKYYYEDKDNKNIVDAIDVDFIKNNINNYRIFILNTYCENEILKFKFYFWSDIRTQNGEAGKFGWKEKINDNENVSDLDILWNLCQQYNWINILKPEVSMVKWYKLYWKYNYK